MNDQLFWDVFKNKYLKNQVFYFSKLNRSTRKYDDIRSVHWCIQNRYWSLLKDKINRKEYLILHAKKKNVIFSIKEFDFFVQLFETFKDYFPLVPYCEILQEAAMNDNLLMLQYLYNLGYKGDVEKCLDFAISNRNSIMVRYLLETFVEIKITDIVFNRIITLSIEINDIGLLQYMKQHSGSSYDKLELGLQTACDCGRVEIFKLLYTPTIMTLKAYWFTCSTHHLEMFKYLVETFDKQITKEWYIEMARSCKYKSHQAILYLLNNDLISQDIFNSVRSTIAIDAFKNNDDVVYQQFKDTDSNQRLKTLYLSSVVGATDTLERVKQLLDMGLVVDNYSIILASKNSSFQVLDYLWSNEFRSRIPLNLFISRIGGVVNKNQFELLKFLIKNQYSLSNDHWWWLSLCKVDSNLLFIELFISAFVPSIEDISKGLTEAATFNCINIFRYLYNLLLERTTTPTSLDQSSYTNDAYESSATNSNKQILEYLIQQKAKHRNSILGRSASIEIAELLLSSGTHTITQETIPNIVEGNDINVVQYLVQLIPLETDFRDQSINRAIIKSIQQAKFQYFKFLLDHSNDRQDPSILIAIGNSGNMQMMVYYCQNCSIPQTNFRPFFLRVIENGHLPLAKYLIDKIDIETLLDARLFYKLIRSNHIHLLEYFKVPISLTSNIFKQTIKLSSHMPINDYEKYNSYLKDFISFCINPKKPISQKKKGVFSFLKK